MMRPSVRRSGRGSRVRLSVLTALVVFLVFSAVGCATQSQTTGAQSSSATAAVPVKIGALLDLTGPAAQLGQEFKQGIELRLEEAKYQVAGRTINLVIEDTATDPTTALEKARKLVEQQGVQVTIGPLMGDAQIALAPYFAEKQVMSTSLIDGMKEVTDKGTWIVYPSTPFGTTFAAGLYAHDTGYRTMVTVGADYAGGHEYIAGVIGGFKDRGGTITQQVWTPVGTADFSPFLSTLKKDSDVIAFFFPNSQEAITFITQARQLGVKTPILATVVDVIPPQTMKDLGANIEGLTAQGSYIWSRDDPTNKQFVAAVEKKLGAKPSGAMQNAYTLASVILAGLEKTAGDTTFKKLRPAVLNLKMDTPQGPISFTSRGIALTNVYIVKATVVGGEYQWVPIKVYKDVQDPRLQ